MSAVVADRYHSALLDLADRSERAFNAVWDRLDRFDVEGSLVWHEAAAPIVEAVSSSAVALTEAFADAVGQPGQLVPAVGVSGQVATVWEPFDVIQNRLGKQLGFEVALKAAKVAVQSVAVDAVMEPARFAMSWAFVERQGWVRKLDPKACPWCMGFSDVVFDSAEQGGFGHDNCKCVPVPSEMIGDLNDRVRKAQKFDGDAQRRFENRKQIRRIEERHRHALERSRQSGVDLMAETDPARRERLSIREQEWETRAELFAERLRILRTGTHLVQ